MTREEFNAECCRLCPHCRGGHAPRYRPETREFVHDRRTASMFSITLCHADKFRNDNKEFFSE